MNARPEAPTSNTTDLGEIHRRFIECRDSAFREGLLDDGFQELMKMAEFLPDFTINSLRMFCEESQSLLTDLTDELGKPDPAIDFFKLGILSWDLRVYSVSVGAKSVVEVCDLFRTFIAARNVDQCRRTLLSLRGECVRARRKIEMLHELASQLLAGSLPVPRSRAPSL